MPKKKKGTATKSKKRGGTSKKWDIEGWLLTIGGAVIANKITAWATKADSKVGEFAPYAALAVGIGLPMFVKHPMVQKVSIGLIAGGGVEALKKLAPKLISGLRGPYDISVVGKHRNGENRKRLSERMAGNAMNPNGIGYSPMRNSAMMDALSVISGVPMNGTAAGR